MSDEIKPQNENTINVNLPITKNMVWSILVVLFVLIGSLLGYIFFNSISEIETNTTSISSMEKNIVEIKTNVKNQTNNIANQTKKIDNLEKRFDKRFDNMDNKIDKIYNLLLNKSTSSIRSKKWIITQFLL